jgi:Transposase zinc-binding domain
VTEHRLEVADVIRQHGEEFLKRWGHTVSPQQRKALRDIGACRTASLGGHIEQCDQCARQIIAYNFCRNRHCPKCQSSARDHWLAERANDLLPVSYCHVVFTVPDRLASLALQNQRVLYGLLFRAVSETLLEIASDPKRLGAQIGFLAVPHTWSQSLARPLFRRQTSLRRDAHDTALRIYRRESSCNSSRRRCRYLSGNR